MTAKQIKEIYDNLKRAGIDSTIGHSAMEYPIKDQSHEIQPAIKPVTRKDI